MTLGSFWARLERKLRPTPPSPVWTTFRWDIINAVIARVGARRYLEIGVSVGQTFERIRCEERVGVDIVNPRGVAGVVTTSSDKYFSREQRPFDLIFVDGLHSYEQSWKDAVGALRVLAPGGVLLLHDCNPMSAAAAMPFGEHDPGSVWNGQVYNTANRLRLSRGIQLLTVDTDFGVGIVQAGPSPVTLLDPYEPLSYRKFARRREEHLNLRSVAEFERWLETLSPLAAGVP
jgi:hypothetical protein